jgi:HEAT repeat protein
VNPFAPHFALLSLLSYQTTQPATDAATVLSRARIAEESGDLPKAEALLLEAIASKDARVTSEALARLGVLRAKLGGGNAPKPSGQESPIARRVREAVETMQQLPNPEAVAVAREGLSWIGEPAVPLLEVWIQEPSILTTIRDYLVDTVAGIGGEAAASFLERLADSPDELLRRRAVEVLEGKSLGVTEERRASVAARFLSDADPTTRRLALLALRESPKLEKERLVALARDRDARIREVVAKYFGKVLPAEGAEALIRDPASSVRREVARVSKGGGWPDAARVGARLIGDADPQVRTYAVETLARTGPAPAERDAVRATLMGLVSDPSANVRLAVASSARKILGAEATPILVSLVLDTDEKVAKEAMSGLERRDVGMDRREDLAAILDRAVEVVRRYPFRDPAGGGPANPTIGDRYFAFLADFAKAVASPDDFGRIARVLGELPSAARHQRGAFGSLLARAGPTGTSFLCDLFDQFADPEVRGAIVAVLGAHAESIPPDLHERVVTVVVGALKADGSTVLTRQAVRLGIAFDLEALGFDLAKTLESWSWDHPTWPDIVRQLAASREKAPAQAAACLASLAICPVGSQAERVQADAVDHLASFPTAVSLPALARVFEEAENESIRSKVIQSVPSDNPEVWTRFLLEKALPSPGVAYRASAIFKLAENRAFTPDVVGRVTEASKDPAYRVRLAVLDYLRAWNNPGAVLPALGLLKDSDENVRRAACSTLGMLLAKESAPELLKALADDSEKVRNEAKQALERIRFYHEEKKRWEDWYAGRGTDPGEGVRKLLELLDDSDEPVRMSAIESLGTMKAKEALPRLVELVKLGASKAEREAAAKAVERINRE